jgi:hypothetical protein
MRRVCMQMIVANLILGEGYSQAILWKVHRDAGDGAQELCGAALGGCDMVRETKERGGRNEAKSNRVEAAGTAS